MRSIILLALVFLSSCATNRMIETDLYFGLSKPNGESVTEKEWIDFKQNHLSAVFKEGSTVINATGNWRDTQTGKLISEQTYVAIYFHKKSKEISKQIDSLRSLYRKMFEQRSVLRVDKKVSLNL